MIAIVPYTSGIPQDDSGKHLGLDIGPSKVVEWGTGYLLDEAPIKLPEGLQDLLEVLQEGSGKYQLLSFCKMGVESLYEGSYRLGPYSVSLIFGNSPICLPVHAFERSAEASWDLHNNCLLAF